MDLEIELRLLTETAQGREDAFAKLYERTNRRLYAVALNLLRQPDRAEEAVQEAYVRIWYNAGEYHQERGSVFTWMSSIVRYRCLDMLRSRKLREDKQDEFEGDESLPETEQTNLLDDLVLKEDAPQLGACMQTLDEGEQHAIHLAYFRGLTHSEITEQLGSPLGSVKSWIRRGLQRLKRCLES
ncbi:RNA polymerase sigma factor [Thalassolituus oleivorans]|uniref:RNA polymerase sigma factor n=1 Tax=Thalassolituus oleivorans TaxID=187493 RepID=UPI0023EF713B|nr:sigma-70 family RNA polymerase sigma factor [Thalassolituus oleivorans]